MSPSIYLCMHSLVSCRTATVTCTRLTSAAREHAIHLPRLSALPLCLPNSLSAVPYRLIVEAGAASALALPITSRYHHTALRPSSSCMDDAKRALPVPVIQSNPTGHLASQSNTTAW